MKKIFLLPPPGLPIPAVKGGAVETLLTHLIEKNEIYGELELYAACLPDASAGEISDRYRHTHVFQVERPARSLDIKIKSALGRRMGKPLPEDQWYLAVEKVIEQCQPDLIIGEGGNLTELCAISRKFGKERCLAHLHGHTLGSERMDGIYGGVLALSQFIRDAYLEGSSLSPEQAYILHNCIDVERFCPQTAEARCRMRNQLGYTDRDFVIVFCGRLAWDKGIHKLVEAMSMLPEQFKLLVVGSAFFGAADKDEFTADLERQAKALGNRVQFTGYQPAEQLPLFYAAADCGCVPTLVEEAAGLSAMEEIACGLPVVAANSGGMPEYLEGSKAILVERNQQLSRQLADAFLQLQANPHLREKMSAAGTRRGHEFSTDAYYHHFVEIINRKS